MRKLILLALVSAPIWAAQYPTDAGYIDVTLAPYNAPHYAMVGGTCNNANAAGAGDATSAIQSAIWFSTTNTYGGAPIIYLPNGCYKVTNTLWWQSSNDGETPSSTGGSGFIQMIGQSQAGAALYVPATSANFQSTSNCSPGTYQGWISGTTGCKAVLYTCQNYTGSGPAYCPGNNGYMTNIHELTVEIGPNNPGAVGISTLYNNSASLRNVTITSDDQTPIYGLDLSRQLWGPGLIENVTIKGFQWGIIAGSNPGADPINGITMNHIHLSGQAQGGMAVYNQQIWARDFNYVGSNSGLTANAFASITLISSTFTGGASGVSAIVANGTLGSYFLRAISCSGFASCFNNNGVQLSGGTISEYASNIVSQFPSVNVSLNLPITDAPTYVDTNFAADWANVTTYGADKTGSNDSTAAIQSAMNSGKPVVYFPYGLYRVDGNPNPVTIPATVRLVEGMGSCMSAHNVNASYCLSSNGFANERTPFTQSANANTIVQDFHVNKYDVGCMTYTGPGTFVMTDIFDLTCFGATSTGNIFTDDSAITGINIAGSGSGHFWCLQCNTETSGAHIALDNETAWILGFKVEGDSTGGQPCYLPDNVTSTPCGIMWAHDNAVVEVLGGWFYDGGDLGYLMQNSQFSIVNSTVPNTFTNCYSESRNSGTPKLQACNTYFDGTNKVALYSGNTYTTNPTPPANCNQFAPTVIVVQCTSVLSPSGGANTSITTSFPQAVQAGDTLIAVPGFYTATIPTQTVTDTLANTWTSTTIRTYFDGANYLGVQAYVACNSTGGADAILDTFNITTNYPVMQIYEVKGVPAICLLTSSGSTGVSSTATSGSATTGATALFLGFVNAYTPPTGAGGSSTLLQNPTLQVAAGEGYLSSGAGSYTSTFPFSGSTTWVMTQVALGMTPVAAPTSGSIITQ